MDKSKFQLPIPLLSSSYSKEPYSILSLSEGRLASLWHSWTEFLFFCHHKVQTLTRKKEGSQAVSPSSKTVNKEHSAFSKRIWFKRLPDASEAPVEKCGWQYCGHAIAQHWNPAARRQLLPTTTHTMLVFLLTQIVIQSSDPQSPCRAEPEPESCFTLILFTSVWGTISSRQWNKRAEMTAAAWDSTLNWAQLQCCKNSARHQLISPVFFALLHSCNCWVPPHSLWRGGFIFIIYVKAELHFSLWKNAAFKLQKNQNTCQVQSVQLLFLRLKACINTLPKYCRNLARWLSTVGSLLLRT